MTATVRGISVNGREGSISDELEREYRAVYKVQTDDKNDGPKTVRTAFGIPNIGDSYALGTELDLNAVVISKEARQLESPNEWEVEVTFSSESEDPDKQNESPLEIPADIVYSFASRRHLVRGFYVDPNSPAADDFDGAMVAPNGEDFVPQPEVDIAEPVLTITKNYATINGATLMSWANTVNLTVFQGADPRQLRMAAPEARTQFDKEVGEYWQVTFTLHYRWETWDVQVLNQGTFYWDGGKPADLSTKTPKIRKDEFGNVLIVNLTTSGDINNTTTPTYTRKRVYREIDFNTLGIFD